MACVEAKKRHQCRPLGPKTSRGEPQPDRKMSNHCLSCLKDRAVQGLKFSTEFNKISKIWNFTTGQSCKWKLILCFTSNETQYMVISTGVHTFYQSSAERREDKASSHEAGAAFQLVTFCCDHHGNTKCQKQI